MVNYGDKLINFIIENGLIKNIEDDVVVWSDDAKDKIHNLVNETVDKEVNNLYEHVEFTTSKFIQELFEC